MTVSVSQLDVSYETPSIAYHDFGGEDYYSEFRPIEYVLRGHLDPEVLEKMCYEQEEQNSLSKRLRNAQLDESDALLRKHNVVRDDGTLTETGKDFLLNLLLDEKEDVVIEALEAIENAEEE